MGRTKREYASSKKIGNDPIMLSDEEMSVLCKDIGIVTGKHFRDYGGIGYTTLEIVDGTSWRLYDDKNPRFNVWTATFLCGNSIKECFDKFVEPRWFHKFRYYGQADRATLIRMMWHEGYDFEGIKASLGIEGVEVKRLLTKFPAVEKAA